MYPVPPPGKSKTAVSIALGDWDKHFPSTNEVPLREFFGDLKLRWEECFRLDTKPRRKGNSALALRPGMKSSFWWESVLNKSYVVVRLSSN